MKAGQEIPARLTQSHDKRLSCQPEDKLIPYDITSGTRRRAIRECIETKTGYRIFSGCPYTVVYSLQLRRVIRHVEYKVKAISLCPGIGSSACPRTHIDIFRPAHAYILEYHCQLACLLVITQFYVVFQTGHYISCPILILRKGDILLYDRTSIRCAVPELPQAYNPDTK